MTRTLALFFFVFAFSNVGASPDVWASSNEKSAHRELGTSWLAYSTRAKALRQSDPLRFPSNGVTAVDAAVEFDKAELPHPTLWDSTASMEEHFKKFRDERFLVDENHQNFLRRSTWLYPDDGCYARAALAIRNLLRWKVEVPKKVFVFGDLAVKSPNIEGGVVGWWYHVAPIVEVAGAKWVLDPAIEPHGPLKLEDWLSRMSSNPGDLQVAICNSGTYTPYDPCSAATDGREEMAENDQRGFLMEEWRRLIELRRNPERELGDNPPWN